MKKLLFGTIFLAMVVGVSIPTMAQQNVDTGAPMPPPAQGNADTGAPIPPPAQGNVNPGVPMPPPIPFSGPPSMVVLPDTDVYVAPDYAQDLYFYQGFWWRLWLGRWYRSLYYDSGWGFYYGVPGWYGGVYPRWRDNYRNHMWGGQRWDYRRVPYGDVRTNWRSWQSSGYWRNQQNRGTTGSYRQGAEARRDFRGFGQATKGRQASGATRPSLDLSKNRSAFGGVERGSAVRMQSNRGLQSRQRMSSKGGGGAGRGNVGRHR